MDDAVDRDGKLDGALRPVYLDYLRTAPADHADRVTTSIRAGPTFSLMTDHFRELNHRSTDRIDVRLLWRQRDDRVIVTVADGKTGERFTVDVTEGASALDVFHHPFAYAA